MIKLPALFALLLMFSVVSSYADTVKFKAPALKGKIIANNLELTDWQTVMHCHFNNRGIKKEFLRYPSTQLRRIETQAYLLKIKPMSLFKNLPHADLIRCSYKLTLIGKNLLTRQLAFGEIVLLGRENGTMSESELQTLQDSSTLSKILNEKIREITITFGKEGGIVEEN